MAAGTARLGLKTVLIERAEMGGECLNSGCVPSKALLAAGKAAWHSEVTDIAGVTGATPHWTLAPSEEMRAVIDALAPQIPLRVSSNSGVTVLRDSARFVDARTVGVGSDTVSARWFVIATGSRAVIPKITGLEPSEDSDK